MSFFIFGSHTHICTYAHISSHLRNNTLSNKHTLLELPREPPMWPVLLIEMGGGGVGGVKRPFSECVFALSCSLGQLKPRVSLSSLQEACLPHTGLINKRQGPELGV